MGVRRVWGGAMSRVEDDARVLHYCRQQGVSDRFLEQLLGVDRATLVRRLDGAQSHKVERGQGNTQYHIYDLAEAVAILGSNDEDALIAAIEKMKPEDVPVKLQKDFWAAMSSRRKYVEEGGDLWRTERVLEVFTALLKIVRQQIVLFENNLDQQDALSPVQRKIVVGLADGLLDSMYRAAQEQFKGYVGYDHDLLMGSPE